MSQQLRSLLFVAARRVYRLPRSLRGRNRLFTLILRLAQRLGPPIIVEVDGLTLQLDMRDGLCREVWAERSFPQGHVLRELCHPGDVVIDVGANIGHMSLMAAREVGPTGRVIAIEPGSRAFTLLQRNAALNFPDRITSVRAACDESDGTATLYVSKYSAEHNSLRPEPVIGGIGEEIVPTRSLQSLCRELDIIPDVIKIDVEGAEWRVLKGLLGGEGPFPRSLLVEGCARHTRGYGYLPSAMCKWLRGQGYEIGSLSRDTEQFEYSDARADGSLLHDIVAWRIQ
jgi:FkbM family methyltransferase